MRGKEGVGRRGRKGQGKRERRKRKESKRKGGLVVIVLIFTDHSIFHFPAPYFSGLFPAKKFFSPHLFA